MAEVYEKACQRQPEETRFRKTLKESPPQSGLGSHSHQESVHAGGTSQGSSKLLPHDKLLVVPLARLFVNETVATAIEWPGA